MKDSLHTLTYAACLGAVCSLLLAAVGHLTAPYREANERAEEVRSILGVLGVPVEAGASSRDLLEVFERNVRVRKRDGLDLYVYEAEGRERSVAVAFSGPGLWGPIRGFLALEPDMRTIRAITFHQQEETPGLGGEITSEWFRDQFRGRSIVSEEGRPGIRIGGSGGGPNRVDGITGATMTCRKVEDMLNRLIERLMKEAGSDA